MLSEKVIKNKAREFRQGGKDMRIAILTNNYRPFVGGVPISVERQAEELIKLGHQVTVFAPMYGETQEEREAVLAADVSAPEQVVRYGTQKRKMDNGMVYPSFYPSEIMEAFERDEFDCIHVHHPMFVGPCALYLKRKYRLPLIYTYHTRYEDYLHYIPGLRVDEKSFVLKKKAIGLIRTKIIPTYMSWFANQCDLVLAPSAGMQKILWEYGMRSRSAVFPTGLEKSFFAMDEQKAKEIRKTYKGDKKHLFVTVSRLEKEKNYEFILRGIAKIKEEAGDDFHVMILGDGSQKGELKTKAALLGIGNLVTFVGNVKNEDVKHYVHAADLFLFASKSETQGIVLAEAMAAGTPVVAVHAVGSDDIVKDGVNGFLTEEEESRWAEKVIEAAQPENRFKMKKAALKEAQNYRSDTLALYEEMLYNQCICGKAMDRQKDGKGEYSYENGEAHGEGAAMAVHKISHIA